MRIDPAFIYSHEYECDIGDHIFPIQKYRRVFERLVTENILKPEQFIDPPTCPWEDVALIHTPEYIYDMRKLRQTPLTYSAEMPLTDEIIEAFRKSTGGTVQACRLAMERGAAMNIGGGMHHSFADHGEGFCYINDVAIGAKKMLTEGLARRIAVVDCDVHQGNGTAHIFQNETDVFTFSIHHEDNYPPKMRSNLDIGLDDGVGDEEYLRKLGQALDINNYDFNPDAVIYVAGADPYMEDQLGGLALTFAGLMQRDRLVFRRFLSNNTPVVVTLAGGYAAEFEDTAIIHANTAKLLLEWCQE